MGAMGQIAPVEVLESVPLRHEVVPAVITDLLDSRMGRADVPDMWGVQHDLTAVGDDGLYLVEAFGAGPHVVVLGRYKRQDPTYRRVEVADVRIGRYIRRCRPRSGRVAERHRMQVPGAGLGDQAQYETFAGDHRGGLVDQGTHRSDSSSIDDLRARYLGPEPMRQVDQFTAGDAGEKIGRAHV